MNIQTYTSSIVVRDTGSVNTKLFESLSNKLVSYFLRKVIPANQLIILSLESFTSRNRQLCKSTTGDKPFHKTEGTCNRNADIYCRNGHLLSRP